MTSAAIHLCGFALLTLLTARPAIYGVQSGLSSLEVNIAGSKDSASLSQEKTTTPTESEKNPPLETLAEAPIQDPPPDPDTSASVLLPMPQKVSPPTLALNGAAPSSAAEISRDRDHYFKPTHYRKVGSPGMMSASTLQGADTYKPAFLRNPPPTYPEQARRAGEEGLVLLRVAVNALGEVDSVSIVTSSGYEILDRAALRAVKNWKFRPSEIGGTAINSELAIPIRFRLTES